VLAQLMAFIAEIIFETRTESLDQPGRPEQSLPSHRKIADAVRAQDAEGAAEAMPFHIELVSDVVLLR
jgi:GntR family transcriptional regulator, transcriptional repressor for pyruvate dehydrogenase complex